MKNRNQIARLAIVGIIMALAVLVAAPVSAKDWHELRDLDDGQLVEKISELQRILDQNPSDYETMKGIGITYHRMAKKNAKTYAPKAVECLAKAFEVNKKRRLHQPCRAAQ